MSMIHNKIAIIINIATNKTNTTITTKKITNSPLTISSSPNKIKPLSPKILLTNTPKNHITINLNNHTTKTITSNTPLKSLTKPTIPQTNPNTFNPHKHYKIPNFRFQTSIPPKGHKLPHK